MPKASNLSRTNLNERIKRVGEDSEFKKIDVALDSPFMRDTAYFSEFLTWPKYAHTRPSILDIVKTPIAMIYRISLMFHSMTRPVMGKNRRDTIKLHFEFIKDDCYNPHIAYYAHIKRLDLIDDSKMTALMTAVTGGAPYSFLCILRYTHQIDFLSQDGLSALSYAIIMNDGQSAYHLLNKGARIRHESHKYPADLIIAVKNNSLAMVELLCYYDAELEVTSKQLKNTALMCASRAADSRIFHFLLKLNAKCYGTNVRQENILTIAIAAGRERIVEHILTLDDKEQLMHKRADGHGPASLAVIANNLTLLKQVIHSDTLDGAQGPGRDTLLTLAAKRGHREILQWLLSQGADIGACDDEGHTALDHALTHNHQSSFRLLLAHGLEFKDLAPASLMRAVSAKNGVWVAELLQDRDNGNQASASPIFQRFTEAILHEDLNMQLFRLAQYLYCEPNQQNYALTHRVPLVDRLVRIGANWTSEGIEVPTNEYRPQDSLGSSLTYPAQVVLSYPELFDILASVDERHMPFDGYANYIIRNSGTVSRLDYEAQIRYKAGQLLDIDTQFTHLAFRFDDLVMRECTVEHLRGLELKFKQINSVLQQSDAALALLSGLAESDEVCVKKRKHSKTSQEANHSKRESLHNYIEQFTQAQHCMQLSHARFNSEYVCHRQLLNEAVIANDLEVGQRVLAAQMEPFDNYAHHYRKLIHDLSGKLDSMLSNLQSRLTKELNAVRAYQTRERAQAIAKLSEVRLLENRMDAALANLSERLQQQESSLSTQTQKRQAWQQDQVLYQAKQARRAPKPALDVPMRDTVTIWTRKRLMPHTLGTRGLLSAKLNLQQEVDALELCIDTLSACNSAGHALVSKVLWGVNIRVLEHLKEDHSSDSTVGQTLRLLRNRAFHLIDDEILWTDLGQVPDLMARLKASLKYISKLMREPGTIGTPQELNFLALAEPLKFGESSFGQLAIKILDDRRRVLSLPGQSVSRLSQLASFYTMGHMSMILNTLKRIDYKTWRDYNALYPDTLTIVEMGNAYRHGASYEQLAKWFIASDFCLESMEVRDMTFIRTFSTSVSH